MDILEEAAKKSIDVARLQRGFVRVYVGPGKGKTTAALGLAMRAVGQGLEAIMVRFVERGFDYGEDLFVQSYPCFQIIGFNKGKRPNQSKEELRSVAEETLAYAERVLTEGNYHVVILDDIFVAIEMGLLSVKDVLNLINIKRPWIELILTGRSAPIEVMKQAHQVTQMLLIKHPFLSGMGVRKGIDY